MGPDQNLGEFMLDVLADSEQAEAAARAFSEMSQGGMGDLEAGSKVALAVPRAAAHIMHARSLKAALSLAGRCDTSIACKGNVFLNLSFHQQGCITT
jgi:hypothetical protein